MKLRVNIVINDPDIEDVIRRLGAYKKAVFIRQAIIDFCRTEKGMKLYNRLLQSRKKTGEKIDLDELL